MGKFAIVRQTKVKGSSHSNSLNAHNDRTLPTENINQDLSHKNITLQEYKYKNYEDFADTKKNEIRERNAIREPDEKKARFPRATTNKKTKEVEQAALSQEFIFTHSHKALSEKQSIEYLKRADEFIREWFDKCEVLSSVIHLDEKTPHIHIDVSYFDKDDKRFIQKELSKQGKTDINAIRAAFQEHVAKDFKLLKQDGTVVEKDAHEEKADTKINKVKEELSEMKISSLEQDKRLSEFAINHLHAPRPKDGIHYTSKAVLDYAESQIEVIKDRAYKKTSLDPNAKKRLSSLFEENTTSKTRILHSKPTVTIDEPDDFFSKIKDFISNRYNWLEEQIRKLEYLVLQLKDQLQRSKDEVELLKLQKDQALDLNTDLKSQVSTLQNQVERKDKKLEYQDKVITRLEKREPTKEEDERTKERKAKEKEEKTHIREYR